MLTKTRHRIAVAIGSLFAVAAVTAVGIAPAAEEELPAVSLVTEAIPIEPIRVPVSVQRYERFDRVQRGDSLPLLAARLGAADDEFIAFTRSAPEAQALARLKPGRSVAAEVDDLGQVHRFEILDETDGDNAVRLRIERQAEGGFTLSEEAVHIERSIEMRTTEIRSSLFAATDAVGIPDAIAIQIADVFSGDIDFNRDLRKGDQLRVLYESVRVAESLEPARTGRVLAIEFINNGRRLEAIWFEREPGRGEYFAFDGRSLKKAFLRSPLEFSRITSHFSRARLHPIKNTWRAHKGTDYGAPIGTRVRTTGDGVVEFAGWKNGYGKVVIVQHGPRFKTLYAHLNGFAKGTRPGARVSQGDVIAYVGRTGWATGPHLHYEFMVDGRHKDPVKVDLPEAHPITASEQERFAELSDSFRRRLDLLDTLRLAQFE